MTSWKQTAKYWLAPVAVLVVVGGCGGETPTATALPSVPVKPEPLPETSAFQAPPIGLTPLPSAEEVQQAAPGGRADPFAHLVGLEAADAPLLLPTGWSVLSIDVARGCIRFALNDEPQDPFCIA